MSNPTPETSISDEQLAKEARDSDFVDAQRSTVGALLYLLKHETDEVVSAGLMQAIRDVRELQQRRAQARPPAITARVCPTCSDYLGLGPASIVHYNGEPCPREAQPGPEPTTPAASEPAACMPTPCQCCECQGKKCIAPHPGHSHRTGEMVDEFMDRLRKASTPTQRLHNLVDSLGRCDRCQAETLDDPVVLCQTCAGQPPSPETPAGEPQEAECPHGHKWMDNRTPPVCPICQPETPAEQGERGTASLKPCGTFVESSIPEYCRTCNWSFESHRPPAPAQPAQDVEETLRALADEWFKLADGYGRAPQGRTAFSRCAHDLHDALARLMKGPQR